jgi:hypothetical protein
MFAAMRALRRVSSLGGRAAAGFVLEIDVSERVPIGVANHEAILPELRVRMGNGAKAWARL